MDEDFTLCALRTLKLTPKDIEISATASDISNLVRVLKLIEPHEIKKIIDLGCGYGGLTEFVAEYLEASEVCGVDVNKFRLQKVRSRGFEACEVDLNEELLPFPDSSFDLVTSFGVLEHIVYYDNLIGESFRVLHRGGYFILSMPNLGSYINRFALLFGYQPRDVEVSSKMSTDFLPIYRGDPIGHIHSATLRSIKRMLSYNGFVVVKVAPISPYSYKSKLLRALDKIFSLSPSLSRRFIILARKP